MGRSTMFMNCGLNIIKMTNEVMSMICCYSNGSFPSDIIDTERANMLRILDTIINTMVFIFKPFPS